MAHQVLLVDDDTSTRYVYRTIMARMGLEVAEAQDGVQAIEFLSHNAPDVVILDLLLPRKPGIEVLEYIYASPHLINTHVIVFSAHDRALVRYLRDDDIFLQKPTSPQYVREAVLRVIEPAIASS